MNNNIKQKCIEFFQNEEFKRDFREFVKPIGTLIYDEFYVYILFLCIYSVLNILIVSANLILLLRLLGKSNREVGSVIGGDGASNS